MDGLGHELGWGKGGGGAQLGWPGICLTLGQWRVSQPGLKKLFGERDVVDHRLEHLGVGEYFLGLAAEFKSAYLVYPLFLLTCIFDTQQNKVFSFFSG